LTTAPRRAAEPVDAAAVAVRRDRDRQSVVAGRDRCAASAQTPRLADHSPSWDECGSETESTVCRAHLEIAVRTRRAGRSRLQSLQVYRSSRRFPWRDNAESSAARAASPPRM